MQELELLEDKLESEGVDVDEIRQIGIDPSLMYWYDEDRHTEDIAAVALTVAAVPQLVTNVLSATAITTEKGQETRVGLFHVERDAIDAYRTDRISKKEYVKQVVDSWSTPWGSDDA